MEFLQGNEIFSTICVELDNVNKSIKLSDSETDNDIYLSEVQQTDLLIYLLENLPSDKVQLILGKRNEVV